jgi:aminoglycoside phosphotransferase (APT) family kinase protein
VNGYSCEIEFVGDTVVRRPRAEGLFPLYDLELQTRVINAIRVPAPAPATYAAGQMTMPFVAGPIPSDFTPLDKWLQGLPDDAARRQVWESTIDVVAAIHREPLVRGLRTGLAAELDYWADYLDWMGGAPEALRDAYAWCRDHAPLATEPMPVLLWGDVRFGNIVYDEATLSPKAVLDWDMVSAGPPEMDIAWLTALDAVGAELSGMAVSGFGTRDEAMERFEHHLGRVLVDFDWYEIFALVRASAIATRIALLAGRDGDQPTLTAALQRIGG